MGFRVVGIKADGEFQFGPRLGESTSQPKHRAFVEMRLGEVRRDTDRLLDQPPALPLVSFQQVNRPELGHGLGFVRADANPLLERMQVKLAQMFALGLLEDGPVGALPEDDLEPQLAHLVARLIPVPPVWADGSGCGRCSSNCRRCIADGAWFLSGGTRVARNDIRPAS